MGVKSSLWSRAPFACALAEAIAVGSLVGSIILSAVRGWARLGGYGSTNAAARAHVPFRVDAATSGFSKTAATE
jgi:hypothetical protein